MKHGYFIVIEGTDGAGKATQTELLVRRLTQEGYDVVQMSFPQYGRRSCTLVEDYLNGKFGVVGDIGAYRASIFFAVDRYVASFKLRGLLLDGKIVICDRYVGSNMGHQGGRFKDKDERKKYFEWDHNLEYNIFGIPKPDMNIILHVTPEISQQLVDKKQSREYLQGKKRDIHEDNTDHLRDAESAYIQMAQTFPEFRLLECIEQNALLSVEAVHEKVYSLFKSELKVDV